MIKALSETKYLSIFAVVLAFTLPDCVPMSVATIVKAVLFAWIVCLEYDKFRRLGLNGIKQKKNEYAFLCLVIISCCYDGVINLVLGTELRWDSFLLTAVIFVLFIDYCADFAYKDLIELFVKACDVWVVISFLEVAIRVIFFPSHDYYLLLCNYDNGLGAYLPPIVCLNLYFLKNNHKSLILILGVVLSLLQVVMVASVTAIMCMLFILIVWLAVRSGILIKWYTSCICLLGSIITFLVFVVYRVYDCKLARVIIKNIMHKDMTLSRRTRVWDSAFGYIKDSLIFGHGADTINQKKIFGVQNAHNFYLDISCRSGAIGLIFAAACFVIAILLIKKSGKRGYEGNVMLCYFFALLIPMQFESYCNYPGYPLYYFLFVFAVCLERLNNYNNVLNTAACASTE